MIIGSFSPAGNSPSVIDRIRKTTAHEGLVFIPVAHGDFTGGYFPESRLPYASSDYYYYNDADDVLVLMWGAVYNRAELIDTGRNTKPVPDPELIAGMFLQDGPGFVEKLNGDFAIFIGQPAKKQGYLFRDHVGIRPLAYTVDAQTLCFSSDIVGLCGAFSDDRVIDREYLLGYFKYIDYRRAPDERVKKLPPGHFLHFSESGFVITKYWEPGKIRVDKRLPYETMLSELKNIVTDAVRIRSDRRFNAGAHVTGGLDSGIVATMARKEYSDQEHFYGFSWSPPGFTPSDIKYDERELIFSTCNNAGILPVFSEMNGSEFLRIVSKYYSNQGYFSEDKTAEQAVIAGTNLIFSGWGGDEFISTGDRGIETDLLTGFHWRTFFHRNPVIPPKKFIRYFLQYVVFPALGILDRDTRKSFRDDARYIKTPYKRSDRKALRNYFYHTSRRQLHLKMLRFYHLQERCESWAVNGFRKGIEYRYPLLDRRIIEYMLKVPSVLLCRTDRFRPLLRVIGEGLLPEEVRLQADKSDPVCWGYMDELFKGSSSLLMDEVEQWKENPDLHFADFDLLTDDIAKYKIRAENVNGKSLFRALVYLKAINDFTVEYRK
jgi:asparagine synthase (glutamine-hydrolysing)